MKLIGKCFAVLVIMFSLMAGMNILHKDASAASSVIQFSVSSQSIRAGEEFSVNMLVDASEGITGIDAYVSYDSQIMTYVNGSEGISGGSGLLHVYMSKSKGKNSRYEYVMMFRAAKAGTGTISISDEATVKGKSGSTMQATSNRVSVNVSGEAVAEGTETLELSNDNALISLGISSGTLEPQFSGDVTEYTATVDCNTEAMYFTYQASDKKAAVSFFGNESLNYGDNTVMVTVTAQNDETRDYIIKVKKETEAETEKRLAAEGANQGIGFDVYVEDGAVYLQNQYRFRIVDVDESTKVPAGYKKTSVLLYGINVTAYTIEDDLDNEYLLMYCMNESGDTQFYQYDRQEKSLQRYTGGLVDKVNQDALNGSGDGDMNAKQYESNLRQMAIIIAVLAALCVLLVLAIINIILRQTRMKNGRTRDEFDY